MFSTCAIGIPNSKKSQEKVTAVLNTCQISTPEPKLDSTPEPMPSPGTTPNPHHTLREPPGTIPAPTQDRFEAPNKSVQWIIWKHRPFTSCKRGQGGRVVDEAESKP
jgi:hypothetical protein